MRMQVQSLALLSGLRIWHCHELWCRSQMQLRSHVAVLWCRLAAAAPIRPLAWEPPYAVGAAREMAKRQKKERNGDPWKAILKLWFRSSRRGAVVNESD